jgi:hypothetical protein
MQDLHGKDDDGGADYPAGRLKPGGFHHVFATRAPGIGVVQNS